MIPGPLKGILELAAAALGPAHAAILDEEVSRLDKRMEELETSIQRQRAIATEEAAQGILRARAERIAPPARFGDPVSADDAAAVLIGNIWHDSDDVRVAARSLGMVDAPAPDATPDAWLVETRDGNVIYWTETQRAIAEQVAATYDREAIPLYRHPPTAAPDVVPELMIESHDPSDIPEGRSARWVKDPDRENGGYWAYPAVPMEELEALRSLYSWMSAADEGGVKVSFSLTEFPEGQTCLSGIANALAALDALRSGEVGKGREA